ncbi:hypothetical protein PIROE2DRAFT_8102, partial [Piromyces sp. E2]
MFNCEYDVLNIPTNENKEINEQYEKESVGNYYKSIDYKTSSSINNYIKKMGISKTAFFLTIYGYVLSKFSKQDIIYSSIISANRNNHYTENMVGMFASTQPILLKYNEKQISFNEQIKNIMNVLMELYNYQDISYSELVGDIKLKNVNNAFIYQPKTYTSNEEENSLIYVNDDEHEFNVFDDINSDNSNTTKFDISFDVIENENDYTVFIEYNKKKFEQRLVEKILNCYIEVVNNVDSFINTIQQIEYIPKEEKNRILYEFNNNHYEYEFNKLYHTEFSKVA